MPGILPHYYTSLAPFRECFAAGLPILTYHKLGSRPRGVRLKGLYVSRPLFERQLGELRAAGFRPGSLTRDWPHRGSPTVQSPLESASGTSGTPRRELVITFDDGFQNVLIHGAPVLARHGFRAVQYLVSDLIGKSNLWEQAEGESPETLMDTDEVRAWLGAGHAIGSHSRTHPWLTRVPVEVAREEVWSSRRILEDRFGVAVEHFCYPYGDWNRTVRDLVEAAGYRTACTVEPGVNAPGADPFALKRYTARYRSRNVRELRETLRSWWARLRS